MAIGAHGAPRSSSGEGGWRSGEDIGEILNLTADDAENRGSSRTILTSLSAHLRAIRVVCGNPYLPMQQLLKMTFRMSSAVVAPVISSSGRSAL